MTGGSSSTQGSASTAQRQIPPGSKTRDVAALRDTLLLGWRMLRPRRAPEPSVVVQDSELNGVRLRSYAQPSSRYPVIVLHGLTRQGFDDHRLIRFCRDLAAANFIAYTPDLEGLRGLDLDGSDVERITETIRMVRDDHGCGPGVIGFSVGGTYALIASAAPESRRSVKYVFALGPYYGLEVLLENAFSHATRNPYPILSLDWRCVELLDLTPSEEIMYRDIMDNYCLREGKFTETETKLIGNIVHNPAQAEVRRWWESREGEIGSLQFEGTTHLRDVEAEVLLSCSREDPLIPPSETLRICEDLQHSNLYVRESPGHLDYRRGDLFGMLPLFLKVMKLREEAVESAA